jgi:hypothetical protein
LIGIKSLHPRLFERIDWSTERVLQQTIAGAQEIGLETDLLPTWYDVDDAATLERLREELLASPLVSPLVSPSDAAGYDARHSRFYLESLRAAQGATAGVACSASSAC